jgi:hypothetical protein
VIAKPNLVFAAHDREARKIAEGEGWGTSPDVVAESPIDEWRVSLHWEMAQKNYWFCPDGEWKKNVDMQWYECFRRSCQNIRDYFGVWLKARERDSA